MIGDCRKAIANCVVNQVERARRWVRGARYFSSQVYTNRQMAIANRKFSFLFSVDIPRVTYKHLPF